MLASNGLGSHCRVPTEEEMALSASCTWMTGCIREEAERKVQRGKSHKTRKLVWNSNIIAKAKSPGNH